MFNKMNKSGITIVTILILICITVISLVVFIPKTDKIKYEIIYDGVDGNGIVFRNEEFFDLSSYEKLIYNNIIEGQFVSNGTNVVSAYKKGYIKATLEKLIETEKSIVTYQNQNIINSFDDKQIKNFDFEIDVAIKRMSEDDEGYIELYGNLCRLMVERQEYIRNNYNTDTNDYLQGLYADELNMAESLSQWCDEFNTLNDGFVGFYCDGYESEFTTEKVQGISSCKDFELLWKNDYLVNNNGFKLVKDSTWYIALNVDDASMFREGSYYPVYISNEAQSEVGLLERIIEDKKGCVLIFSFSDNVEKYLDIRTTKVFVGQRVEGFCVDRKCVHNGVVTIKENKKKRDVNVNIIYENEDIILFNVSDELVVGQKVYK